MLKPKNNLDTHEICFIWDLKPIPTTEKLIKTFSFSLKHLLCTDTHLCAISTVRRVNVRLAYIRLTGLYLTL